MLRFFDRSRLIAENVCEPTMKVTVEGELPPFESGLSIRTAVRIGGIFAYLSFELSFEF
jgi:hypothetical protein